MFIHQSKACIPQYSAVIFVDKDKVTLHDKIGKYITADETLACMYIYI